VRDGVKIWNVAIWEEVATLRNASSPFSFSPDGKKLAADSRDGGIMVWNIDSNDAGVPLDNSTNLFIRFRGERALAFSPDGKFVVAARNVLSERRVFVLSIWDSESGEEVGTMPSDPERVEHTSSITSIAFSPDGQTFATASLDYSIRLWDFDKRQHVATLQGNLNEVRTIAFSRDGETIVSGGRDGSVKLWPTRPVPHDEEMSGARLPLGFSNDGNVLAALSRTNSVLFFNLNTGEAEKEFQLDIPRQRGGPGGFGPPPGPGGPGFRGITPSISADLKILAMLAPDGAIKLWNTETRETQILSVPDRSISMLALSPDGKILVTEGWGNVRWWNLRQGTNSILPTEGNHPLFSADSRTLALFTRDNGVEIWNVATRSLRTTLSVESMQMFGASGSPVSFSPDGKLLAVASQDDSIALWDVDAAKLIGTLVGHKQGVFTVAFSPDGKTLASASDDSTLKFWNVATQQELLTVRRLGGGLRALTFSRDGRTLVAGTSSALLTGGLRVFHAPSLREIVATETREQ
jgi:WD40 repeat protein